MKQNRKFTNVEGVELEDLPQVKKFLGLNPKKIVINFMSYNGETGEHKKLKTITKKYDKKVLENLMDQTDNHQFGGQGCKHAYYGVFLKTKRYHDNTGFIDVYDGHYKSANINVVVYLEKDIK